MSTIHEASNTMIARLLEVDAFNEAQKAASPGLISQFEANGLNYSIVHNPSYKMVVPGGENRFNPEFYTVYVQNVAIADPDECLVDTDSTDTLFEAVTYIRNHIEKAIIKAFMPEIKL